MGAGGITSQSIKKAAELAALGLDPIKYLFTRDPLVQAMYEKLGKEIMSVRNKMDHNLAVAIANQVGHLFKK